MLEVLFDVSVSDKNALGIFKKAPDFLERSCFLLQTLKKILECSNIL